MSEQSAQYIYANKVGNLVAEKNTKIEELTARIADLEAALTYIAEYKNYASDGEFRIDGKFVHVSEYASQKLAEVTK